MAINTQTIRIDLNTGRTIPVAFAHQNDTNRQLTFQLYNNGVAFTPSSTTVKFAYKSPIVNGRYSVITGSQMASGTVSGNTVTVTLPAQYTQVSGVGLLTMILTTSGNTLRPVNIKFVCQSSADGDDSVLGASDWPEGLYDYMDNWLEENEPTEIANLKSDLSYHGFDSKTFKFNYDSSVSQTGTIDLSYQLQDGVKYYLDVVECTMTNCQFNVYTTNPSTTIYYSAINGTELGTYPITVVGNNSSVKLKFSARTQGTISFRISSENDIAHKFQDVENNVATLKDCVMLNTEKEIGGITTSGDIVDNNARILTTIAMPYGFSGWINIKINKDYNISVAYAFLEGAKVGRKQLTLTNREIIAEFDSSFNELKISFMKSNQSAYTQTELDEFSATVYCSIPNYISCAYVEKIKSRFRKNVDFSVLTIGEWYASKFDTHDAFSISTTYDDFSNAFKTMCEDFPNYITIRELGQASNGKTVYGYHFKPPKLSNKISTKFLPKIFLIVGVHGEEKGSVFGTYYFFHDLLYHFAESTVLSYLRNHVEFVVVPVVNPYGFDRHIRLNANGVDLNRNWDYRWSETDHTQGSITYSGSSAFSEPETKMVRDLLYDHLNTSMIFVDFHTNGSSAVSKYEYVNWFDAADATDTFYSWKMSEAIEYHLSNITGHFIDEFSLDLPSNDSICGYASFSNPAGLGRCWAQEKNILSLVMEGFPAFPNEAAFNTRSVRGNAEILGNWIMTVLNIYSKDGV